MTDFRIERLPLTKAALNDLAAKDPGHRDWPVVYTLNDAAEVYVGESMDGTDSSAACASISMPV